MTDLIIGAMYRVPWSPNMHRLEFIRPRYCQLHGEYIGDEAGFRKKRNSAVRPWGGISVAYVNTPGIVLEGDA